MPVKYPSSPEQLAKKRIRDARYRLNNCGAVQKRVREALRNRKPERIIKEITSEQA
jgi:hypothetical protein